MYIYLSIATSVVLVNYNYFSIYLILMGYLHRPFLKDVPF